MNPHYVKDIHDPQVRRLLESVRDPVPDLPARAARGDDYATRYHAEVEAHALTRHERDDLAGGLLREIRDAAGLRTQCYVLWLIAGALFGAVLVMAGRLGIQ